MNIIFIVSGNADDIHKGVMTMNIIFIVSGNAESSGDDESYATASGNPKVIE